MLAQRRRQAQRRIDDELTATRPTAAAHAVVGAAAQANATGLRASSGVPIALVPSLFVPRFRGNHLLKADHWRQRIVRRRIVDVLECASCVRNRGCPRVLLEARLINNVEDMVGGAGGYWRVADEVADPAIVRQATPDSCGAACGEMLLSDAKVTQKLLGYGTKSAQDLARAMNARGSTEWIANAVDDTSFATLNQSGSWAALFYERGAKTGHWVVVDGVSARGRIMIRDPWEGTKYTMSNSDFFGAWTNLAVYRGP